MHSTRKQLVVGAVFYGGMLLLRALVLYLVGLSLLFAELLAEASRGDAVAFAKECYKM